MFSQSVTEIVISLWKILEVKRFKSTYRDIPESSFDELTGAALDLKQVRSPQLVEISKEILPKLEEIYKDRDKQGEDTPLTAEGEALYRRVLGQLAWAALSRADLCFQFHTLRDTSQSHRVQRKHVCVHCCVGC